ncbi:MAG: OPT/YSL family transporter, partial [Oceanipulchritudo sp.]
GILLATLESVAPEKLRRYLPSASSLGFAFIIPPFISLALFLGAMARVAAERIRPRWSARYLIVIAAGLVAGESLAGILSALASFFG